MEYNIYKDGELYHWGIPGMKWGVRRYQNKDGSLTAAGKRRIKAETEAIKKKEQTLKNRKATQAKFDRLAVKRKALEDQEDELDGKTTKKSGDDDGPSVRKSVKDMTLAELRAANERSQQEEAYRKYHPEPTVPEKTSFVKRIVDEVIVPAAMSSGKKFAENAMDKIANKILAGKADPNSLEAIKATYDKLDYKQKIDKITNPDKYLSEEDKNKRQEREFKAEDRAAQKRGFKDAFEEAKTKVAAEADARKAQADEVARKANEAKSNEYYNSSYSKRGGEKTSVNSSDTGSKYVQKLISGDTMTTSLTTTNNVSKGKSSISGLLNGPTANRKSNEIGYIDADGNFRAYR